MSVFPQIVVQIMWECVVPVLLCEILVKCRVNITKTLTITWHLVTPVFSHDADCEVMSQSGLTRHHGWTSPISRQEAQLASAHSNHNVLAVYEDTMYAQHEQLSSLVCADLI